MEGGRHIGGVKTTVSCEVVLATFSWCCRQMGSLGKGWNAVNQE
jgi:hypothetical protein